MSQDTILPNGKIPDSILSGILDRFTNSQGDRVILGEDAGIVDMSHAVTDPDNCLVAAVDPITVNIQNSPFFAVACNINDVATRGAIPKWATAGVFLPEGSTIGEAESFFRELYEAIKPYNIAIVSGHTEVTSTMRNPGIVMTILGEVKKSSILKTGGAQVGDALILTEGAGIEGTAIIASNLAEGIKAKVSPDVIKRAENFLYTPGICVLKAAQISWRHKPNALHDPTEGGVRKGVEEMAVASRLGVTLDYTQIPIREETRIICEASNNDPLAIFGSGALLISIGQDRRRAILEDFEKNGILAQVIGAMTPADKGRNILMPGKGLVPLTASHTDELIGDIM